MQTAVKREDEQAFALLNGAEPDVSAKTPRAASRPRSTPTSACMTSRFVRHTRKACIRTMRSRFATKGVAGGYGSAAG